MKIRNNDYSIQIRTSKGQKILIDPDDFEKCSKYSWCISKTGYAVANIRGKVTKMHRYILGVKDAKKVRKEAEMKYFKEFAPIST
jgi:hypothetical protein